MSLLKNIYDTIWALVGLAIVVGVIALAWSIIRFNIKRRSVNEAIESARSESLARVISLVESISTEPSAGRILIPSGAQSDGDRCVVAIPDDIQDFPWAGRSFGIKLSTDPDVRPLVSFYPVEEKTTDSTLLGREYRFLAVPRQRTKSGKLKNIFDPERILKLCPELMPALEDISTKYPLEALTAILCDGRIEFEPIDQLRIGTSAAWVQRPEWKYCPICKKRMSLIIQLSGARIYRKALLSGTHYLFGCKDHPDVIESVEQFT